MLSETSASLVGWTELSILILYHQIILKFCDGKSNEILPLWLMTVSNYEFKTVKFLWLKYFPLFYFSYQIFLTD